MKSCSRCVSALAGSKVSAFPFLQHGISGERFNSLVSFASTMRDSLPGLSMANTVPTGLTLSPLPLFLAKNC